MERRGNKVISSAISKQKLGRGSVQKPRSGTLKSRSNMSVSMRDVDAAFQGAGQKTGLEIWRIENFKPVAIPTSSYGKFRSGDSYIILKTTALKSGVFHYDIHYWLGKDTSQDEAGTAAIKTVELDAALGGRAVQHRECQGRETDKFLSYFKPCIIPEEGGVVSGFKHVEEKAYTIRLFACNGKHVVRVREVPYSRSSLNHDDIFILDTKSKIFQFNGSNSSIQERAKALEVVQYIKDTFHEGKCEVAAIEDGKFVADPETGDFWSFFGGFAPLAKKSSNAIETQDEAVPAKLLCIQKGRAKPVDTQSLTRELLDTNKCYLVDSGVEIFVWMGRSTTLEERKSASSAAEELIASQGRSQKAHITRVVEGFETVMFKSNFDKWPQSTDTTVSEEGRGKVVAMLKRQGFNVKGLLKAAPVKEEHQPFIDCTGNLQVWRVNGNNKVPLPMSEQCKFYSGDCYIVQYTYPGEDKEEYLLCTWIGKQSIPEDRAMAQLLVSKMVESFKGQPVQAQIFEGKEPPQFFAILQSFIVYKGGLSSGYKARIMEKGIDDNTYKEDGLALFRVQGTGPDNMQAIQVEPVATSLNSSYCYILQVGMTVFTWLGSLSTTQDHELVERMLDLIKADVQSKPQKEGTESEAFWNALGGKKEYSSQKAVKETGKDPHLFGCSLSRGNLEVTEIFNFVQDDLMTEDMMILDCHSEIYVWVGQQVDSKSKQQALNIGQKYLEKDVLLEKLSSETPIFVIVEGSEPSFFTRFFTWDSSKSTMHGNSFQRKLSIIKTGISPIADKPKRRTPASYGGRMSMPDKTSQRSRSMSFSPDRVRVRGRSPAFNALASAFENPRNLSTPPPVVRKLYPKSVTPDSLSKTATPRSQAIAALTSKFEPFKERKLLSDFSEVSPETPPKKPETTPVSPIRPNSISMNGRTSSNSMSSRIEALTIKEDVKEDEPEDDEGLITFPYERLKISSPDPVSDIDVTKRETYLSSEEFREKFGMTKEAFYKMPKWKQNKQKIALNLF
ncbi:villin-4 isoform X1 [Cryptomeria japonica]|uniref:villin-4 isoform X1 n=2 Tax=Cryptomeria japonica TaxID=3369 RepID=UPI0027D9FF9C|nr:villin-4 isoform X1 [Cryptomeria japonica]